MLTKSNLQLQHASEKCVSLHMQRNVCVYACLIQHLNDQHFPQSDTIIVSPGWWHTWCEMLIFVSLLRPTRVVHVSKTWQSHPVVYKSLADQTKCQHFSLLCEWKNNEQISVWGCLVIHFMNIDFICIYCHMYLGQKYASTYKRKIKPFINYWTINHILISCLLTMHALWIWILGHHKVIPHE